VDVVLARVLEEIAEHGVEHLSVERIARAADVNRSSVYRRWPTREALVAAALARVARDMHDALPDQGSLRADLVVLATRVAALLDTAQGRALVQAAFVQSGGAPPLVPGELPAMVARARVRGEWRDGVPPAHVLAMLVGALLHRSVLERAPADAAWVGGLVDLLVAAVAPGR
jgi:AcrR family transcriptional regulator